MFGGSAITTISVIYLRMLRKCILQHSCHILDLEPIMIAENLTRESVVGAISMSIQELRNS